MFEHEAEVINQVMNQIEHPNIVKLQAVDFNGHAPWLQYEFVPGGNLKRFPVENVSWNLSQQFIQKLNEKTKEAGWMDRLPREAEWEYACRGGAISQTDCGWNFYLKSPTNTLPAQQANFADSALQRTCKVGMYQAKPLDIYDVHGNVLEWCEDSYDGSDRVFRGGSWSVAAGHCRAAYRVRHAPAYALNNLGLRLARVPVR
jgi:formylglycine-generating enzyme required for sulfatase activity